MILGVDHIGITVPDAALAAEFFAVALGISPPPVERLAHAHIAGITGYSDAVIDVALVPLPDSDAMLELIEYVHPRSRTVDMETFNVGNTHVAFRVDDIDAALQRLATAGSAPRSREPVQARDGALAGARFAYVRGPGGITLELYEPARAPR